MTRHDAAARERDIHMGGGLVYLERGVEERGCGDSEGSEESTEGEWSEEGHVGEYSEDRVVVRRFRVVGLLDREDIALACR